MKHLIIDAHPNPNSISRQFTQAVTEQLSSQGHDVQVRDLYQLNFNPVLTLEDMHGQRRGTVAKDVENEQAYVSWADSITFIYPIWWTGLPAMMKGYIDRVFSYNFAYRYDKGIQKGLLTGKQAIIINTHGKSHEEYGKNGMSQALALTSDTGIYHYCGFEIKKHFYFDKADKADAATINSWVSEVRQIF